MEFLRGQTVTVMNDNMVLTGKCLWSDEASIGVSINGITYYGEQPDYKTSPIRCTNIAPGFPRDANEAKRWHLPPGMVERMYGRVIPVPLDEWETLIAMHEASEQVISLAEEYGDEALFYANATAAAIYERVATKLSILFHNFMEEK